MAALIAGGLHSSEDLAGASCMDMCASGKALGYLGRERLLQGGKWEALPGSEQQHCSLFAHLLQALRGNASEFTPSENGGTSSSQKHQRLPLSSVPSQPLDPYIGAVLPPSCKVTLLFSHLTEGESETQIGLFAQCQSRLGSKLSGSRGLALHSTANPELVIPSVPGEGHLPRPCHWYCVLLVISVLVPLPVPPGELSLPSLYPQRLKAWVSESSHSSSGSSKKRLGRRKS